MHKLAIVLFLILFHFEDLLGQTNSQWPLPLAQDTFNLGFNIQRTMSRLEETRKNGSDEEIRILFYGQSFVKQAYWLDISEDLRKRFPNANLHIENLAIGGFTNKYLLQTSNIDVIPFYPDLIIYQAQGSPYALDSTIFNIRSQTTAEIILMNSVWKPRDEENPALGWSELYGHTYIPSIASKYGCGYIDTRTLWHKYLDDNQLRAEEVLDETGHMNEYGEFLHAELVKPYFKFQPHHPPESYSGTIHTLLLDRDYKATEEGIRLTASGNRIEVFFDDEIPEGFNAEILIDGKKLSEFEGAFIATRPNGTTQLDWPWEVYAFYSVGWNSVPLEEKWILTVTEVGPNSSWVKYNVNGSKTGYDGEGDSRKLFQSNSGRVVIHPNWWHLKRSYDFMSAREKNKAMTAGRIASDSKETAFPIEVGYTFQWETTLIGKDIITYDNISNSNGGLTIAQGIPNSNHQIQIKTSKRHAELIKKVKVYQPPMSRSL